MSQREADNDSGIERKVLGNILINPEILPFMDFLRPEDFTRSEHRTIYEAAHTLARQGQPFDFITVAEELERQNKLEEVGGGQYLASLMQQVYPSPTLYPSPDLYPSRGSSSMAVNFQIEGKEQSKSELLFNQEELARPETQMKLARLSPSFHLWGRLLDEPGLFLDKLHWREFEELVAELLEEDGYQVQLGRGTKDGGKDIIAMKEIEGHGLFMSVWQAKKLKPGNKVEISVVRELAAIRDEQKASKGIIVTSTYLTRGALERVARDEYILGKVDRDDLIKWIQEVKRRNR
jgi:HJR/Mrr/RecB family endonuclease